MSVGRSAALKIDWAKLSSQLGLKGQTAAQLAAFKKRNEDARRRVQVLSELPTDVDFASYRSQLKNQSVINELESTTKNFKPKTYDVSRELKAIEAFESQAVKNAQETKTVVDKQVEDLQVTLRNIEEARPFDQLTVDDVANAEPEIDKRTAEMVKKGRWAVPGYREKFGYLSLL